MADPPDAGSGQYQRHAEIDGQFEPLERPVPAGRLKRHDLVIGGAELGNAVLKRARRLQALGSRSGLLRPREHCGPGPATEEGTRWSTPGS